MKQGERFERLLFVTRTRAAGDEARARALAERDFPREAFERAGLAGFTVYAGGGTCVFEFGFDGTFDRVFARAGADPEVRAYLDGLGRYVEPAPRIEPGGTAALPIAADVFLWRRESGTLARGPFPRRATRARAPRAKAHLRAGPKRTGARS